jgi:hypothetical protein
MLPTKLRVSKTVKLATPNLHYNSEQYGCSY